MDCEISDNVAHVRQRARLTDKAFRFKKRSMLWNSHRLNIDNIEKYLQIPNAEELTHLCTQLQKKKDPETLRKIRLGLSYGGERITTFLHTDGALYAVIGCLSGTNAKLQREALCTLINLGLGTEKECRKIYDAAGVYIALIISNQSNISHHDLIAWCIGNLCGGHRMVCEQLQRHDILHWLLLLLKSRVPHVFQSTTYALTHYFITLPEEMTKIDCESVTHAVIDGLQTVEEATEEACWLLFVMSADHVLCKAMINMDIISVTLNKLRDIANRQILKISIATALIRILLNCVGAFPEATELVCHHNEKFVSVSKAMLYSSHPHLRAETIQLIANVINGASRLTDDSYTAKSNDLRIKLDGAMRSALASHFSSDSSASQLMLIGNV